MSSSHRNSPFKTAIAALATFTVLVWGGVGLKVALLRGATREMAVAPGNPTTSRPALDRAPALKLPVR
jgi:hypothetical protein